MSSDDSLSCRHSWLRTQYRSTVECLRGLCRDESGNALILLAISVVPLLALVGSSIDMGRAYLVVREQSEVRFGAG
ncbi:TadE/TadG family type IV pilus assembly protein [Novosphingobium sp. CCH12-A3]|uniref:TadE/TadG family type IV pilus assembly protein n=1 Tax=Novosphingobium sp. CCH12-A3 TaxID=1768752 RepID=UPI000784A57D|nr:pilus assembly protein TadG-related protein [Novosphingobium sp. CCH12-A3]